jgi:quinol monooxygenase YgiN
MSIVRINEFKTSPEKSEFLKNFLLGVIEEIKDAPGCLECKLLIGYDDGSRLVIVETWESVAAHQAAAKIIPPERLAEAMSMFTAPPRGSYYRSAT